MLNVKKLSELLARNVDPNLYPRMFIMSPNGTLLAYSRPVDIKELRDQAALISMAWKEHEAAFIEKAKQNSANGQPSQNDSPAPALETLTVEVESNNLIVRALQKNILLVLVGGVPPGGPPVFKMTAEGLQDPRYPPARPSNSIVAPNNGENEAQAGNGASKDQEQLSSSFAESHMSIREKDMKVGVLHIQRKKIDAITKYLRSDFDSRGFLMPDDGVFP